MFTPLKVIKLFSILLLLFIQQNFLYSQSVAQLIPKKGLQVTTNNLTWINGSEISFFTADKKNHHYFFTWWEQDIVKEKRGTEKLLIGSKNTAVVGYYALQQKNRKIETKINCTWNLAEQGVADIVYAKLWLPYFSNAVFSYDDEKEIKTWDKFFENNLVINTPFGTFKLSASHRFKIKVKANLQPHENDFNSTEQYLMIYEDNITTSTNHNLTRTFTIEQISNITSKSSTKIIQAIAEKKADVWKPTTVINTILPQPKVVQYLTGNYIIPKNKIHELTHVEKQFSSYLQLRWQINHSFFPIITTTKNLQLSQEGYKIQVNEEKIYIEYATEQGLQFALQTLAQLVKNENEKLLIPCVNIQDEPSTDWRGIHMFTGPHSWAFHKRMYNHILLPLKANKIVLQCEQAKWKSRPEVHNSISISINDLKQEFNFLKNNYVEPIPLIQSLGHMEWFFKPKQNRVLAINPSYPYTLNPTLPKATQAITQIWNEAVAQLKPKTIHIGFDEIGMIGFNEPKENELKYFNQQITFLNNYAKKRNLRLMMWGDMGLAPKEAPDATNGITEQRAATIRSYIPNNTLIGDWHYLNNSDPEIYKTSLKIWKQNKNIPIASTWFYAKNIKGFVQAAIDEKAGVLQTTWADFESNEKNMLLNMEQFGAYILAMDYAWSARKEMPENLPYHAVKEWANKFYTQPQPIEKKGGHEVKVNFQLKDITIKNNHDNLDTILLKMDNKKAEGFALKANTNHILQEGTVVAEIQFLWANNIIFSKKILYGRDVRTLQDKRMMYAATKGQDERVLYVFFPQQLKLNAVKIINQHAASGLKFESFSLIE